MATVVITVSIDTEAPMGPQLLRLRAMGFPWKKIAEWTGKSPRQLQRLYGDAVGDLMLGRIAIVQTS